MLKGGNFSIISGLRSLLRWAGIVTGAEGFVGVGDNEKTTSLAGGVDILVKERKG